jgi:ABC-type branched-subunit amino acid transport system substrate-binding protein
MQRSLRSTQIITLVGALALTVACGSSSSSDTAGASTATETVKTPTGPPLKLVVPNNVSSQRNIPEVYAGAESAAHAINDEGGVNNRPIVIVRCDSQLTADGTAKCARDAVADPDVIALAGTWVQFGGSIAPIIEQAGMANIGNYPNATADMTSPNSFPFAPGALGTVAGMVTLVTDVIKSPNVSIPYVDVPSSTNILNLLGSVLQTRNGKIVTKVAVPNHAPDLAASVSASTANNPGGIALVLSVDAALQFLQTAKAQAVTIPIVIPGTEMSQEQVAALGGAANGAYVTTGFPPSGGAGNDLFNKQMDKYAAGKPKDDLSRNSWLAVRLFASVAKGLTTITRASVLDALNHLTNVDTLGMTGPVDFTKPSTVSGGKLPRLFNTNVVYNKIENGKFIPVDGKFVNPFVPPTK